MNFASVWTKDRTEKFVELWSSTMSAAEIARELGAGLSRNAVLGKAHRMKLAAKGPSVTDPQVIEARKKKATDRQVAWLRNKRGTQNPNPTPVREEIPQHIVPRNLTFEQIRRFDCRWITNEDMAAPLFCALAVAEGSSWCPHHKHVVSHGSMVLSEEERDRRRDHGNRVSRHINVKGVVLKDSASIDILDEEAA